MSDVSPEAGPRSTSSDTVDRESLRAEMVRSLARGGMGGVQVISWESATTVLTPKRREIVETLRRRDVESVRNLARKLDRDKGQVSRDLADLAEIGIVQYEKNGNAKRPILTQEHVIVEPIV